MLTEPLHSKCYGHIADGVPLPGTKPFPCYGDLLARATTTS